MSLLERIKRLLFPSSVSGQISTPAESTPGVLEWYFVSWDQESVRLDVRPPWREAWTASFRWQDIVRICYAAEDLGGSDGIYVYIAGREASYPIPVEARGGYELWNEILARDLFDANLAIQAAATVKGIFCWPPDDREKVR